MAVTLVDRFDSRSTDAPPLVAHDLYRFYHAGEEETRALRGVTVSLHRGEFTAVIGPSGSGKSTLLACLAGLDDPDGGMVHVEGMRISRQPEEVRASLRARHIGVVYQSHNLIGHLTLRQNIGLAQSLRSRRGRVAVEDLLEPLSLAHRASSFAHELSGGEAARAALAVALANNPTLLLADEPTGELDSLAEAAVVDLLSARAHTGNAVLVATHSTSMLSRADQIVKLSDGQRIPS